MVKYLLNFWEGKMVLLTTLEPMPSAGLSHGYVFHKKI
jgi:hypothetical protein